MIEIGNMQPLRRLAGELAEWEEQIRARPLPESDPVVQAVAEVRARMLVALEEAADVELDLTASQYARLRDMKLDTLYKRWQRGQLPEASMRGGKLVIPVSALAGSDVAA